MSSALNKGLSTLGSLFDGIGGFPYAASFYGIKALWASEILPEAVSVTRRHFPDMAHVGDITRISGGALPPVDIITFGSPCQGLSVQGRRLGLADERSGLFGEAIRIIREMQEATNGAYPKIALWENVVGSLSSTGGLDFKAVLEAFASSPVPVPRSGRWANAGMVRGRGAHLAWVVYCAQHFGVPQRRRRVFLVADFTGGCAGRTLFVPHSLRRYFAAGGTGAQSSAADAGNGALPLVILNDQGGSSLTVEKGCVSPTLRSQTHGNLPVVAYYTAEGVPTVRRLNPTEGERLQGFPDGWTGYGHDGRRISDTKRFEMLGNSIAVPCAAYILQGIDEALRLEGGNDSF